MPDELEDLMDELSGESSPDWFPADGDDEGAFDHIAEAQYLSEHDTKRDDLNEKIRRLINERAKSSIKLKDLAEQWFASGPYPLAKTTKEAKTAIEEFLADCGDILVADLTATTGYQWADKLGKTKGNKTIRKKIGYVSKCLSWGQRSGLVVANPLYGLHLGDYGTKTASYRPFSKEELHQLFDLKMPDHLRFLLTILVTTGMRLDEAALLNWEDIKEQDGRLFFDLTGKEKIVKNIGSQRFVPLHPRMSPPRDRTGSMFPQFKRNADGKAQGPASKALMALIREVTDDPRKVVHSLRGTLKDLLRDAGIDKETNDFITGHGSGDVAGRYGSGPSLKVRAEALNCVEHPWLR